MLKNFVKLFILLAIIITAFVFNINRIADFLFNNTLVNSNERLSRGTFNLVKQELFQYPESKWPEEIKNLQEHFGYPVYVKNISDVLLTPGKKKKLLSNRILITKIDGAETWLTLLKDTDLVLGIEMSQSLTEDSNRSAKGTFYLAIKKFQTIPQAEWHLQLESLQKQFGFPLKLVPIDNLKLDKKLLDEIENNYAVGIKIDSAEKTYYKKLPGSRLVMQAGPLIDSFIVNNFKYILIFIFSLVMALALYFWMRPIWRDLHKLDNVAAKFGQGEFQSRINLPRRSAIWRLSNTFDNMAERINKLINSHKELTTAVSHELRTPISRLRFAIEMLNETKEIESKQRFINSMNEDIDELELLVSELLNYARFDRENPKLEFSQHDMATWLPDITKKIKNENNYKILHYVNSTGQQPAILEFDQKLIERALNNLIRNAVRYASHKVEVNLKCNEHNCLVIIDDDGPGIPAEDRERMLKPFTRQDTSRNRKSGGYGLGLSIVQQIVKWHSGDVNILSSAYGGASFVIKLPVQSGNKVNKSGGDGNA